MGNQADCDPSIIERLKRLDSTTLSDAMDRLSLPPSGLRGLRPILPGKIVCGPAFTTRFVTVDKITDPAGDFLDDVPAGCIVAVDNRGRTDSTVWGDIMAVAAKMRGLEATFIDGVCRDVPGIQEADYPVFSLGAYMLTGKGRTKLEAVQVPIVMRDVRVHPGDLLFGDDSGAMALPNAHLDVILEAAEDIAAKEALIIDRLKHGSSLREARQELGYHSLQTPRG